MSILHLITPAAFSTLHASLSATPGPEVDLVWHGVSVGAKVLKIRLRISRAEWREPNGYHG
jgi:hypothetical protein